MFPAMMGLDAAQAIMSTATQLYAAKKKREEEEKMRKERAILEAQNRQGDAAATWAGNQQSAIDNMIGGFSGILR